MVEKYYGHFHVRFSTFTPNNSRRVFQLFLMVCSKNPSDSLSKCSLKILTYFDLFRYFHH